jgi:Icc-related predicted phosphoesterase
LERLLLVSLAGPMDPRTHSHPIMPDTVRLAALSDIHYSKSSQGSMQPLFTQVAEAADVMLIGGDLTDYGLAEEARILAKDLAPVKIPVVAVLGNHDFESGEEREISKILTDVGVHMLDGDAWEYHDVGFAGVRGFCGGFGRGALGPWGEKIIKDFVHEAVQEALKLESALARLKSDHRIVLMHYAPIRATVEGESPEIFPVLGSSRLEDPLSRFDVTAVFHGHAHKGAPEGRTQTGIPVFNVAHAVLERNYPDRPTFRLFEVHTGAADERGVTPIADRRQRGRRATDRDDIDAEVANPSPS